MIGSLRYDYNEKTWINLNFNRGLKLMDKFIGNWNTGPI